MTTTGEDVQVCKNTFDDIFSVTHSKVGTK